MQWKDTLSARCYPQCCTGAGLLKWNRLWSQLMFSPDHSWLGVLKWFSLRRLASLFTAAVVWFSTLLMLVLDSQNAPPAYCRARYLVIISWMQTDNFPYWRWTVDNSCVCMCSTPCRCCTYKRHTRDDLFGFVNRFRFTKLVFSYELIFSPHKLIAMICTISYSPAEVATLYYPIRAVCCTVSSNHIINIQKINITNTDTILSSPKTRQKL